MHDKWYFPTIALLFARWVGVGERTVRRGRREREREKREREKQRERELIGQY